MNESHVWWISPEAPLPKSVEAGQHRLARKAIFRFGVLDNAKSNADHLLGMLVELLQATTPLASVVRRRKPGPAFAAKPEILDDLTKGADFVVSAMAD